MTLRFLRSLRSVEMTVGERDRNDRGRGSTERIMRRAERTKRRAGAITANRGGNDGGLYCTTSRHCR